MRVNGYEISEAVLDEARQWMRSRMMFESYQIASLLVSKGVPNKYPRPVGKPVAGPASGRLLQAERKAGRIRQVSRGIWEPVVQEDAR